jgi:predicted AlkP superfamily phosphohydrolase/phosphomutase
MNEGTRLLAIGLDGFEISLAERLMAQGRMPNLARLRAKSARYRLNHGPAKYSGLTWEHISSGCTPETITRHSAVSFDPISYHVRQEPTREIPIFAHLKARTVLFDVPYCDLQRGQNLKGITHWGAHDPGAPLSCNPSSLADEITDRFGPYPATDYIYAMVWQSADQTERAGAALAQAVRLRAQVAEWVLQDRIPDWEFALVVVSEPHSAIEPLWHGVDPHHPLHILPSAPIARRGLETVYIEVDSLIGRLSSVFSDASIVVFAMHGMGENGADVPAMVLLPELLYRRQFGQPWMREMPWRHALADGTPLLAETETWHHAMEARVPPLWSGAVKEFLSHKERQDLPIVHEEIDWQPASRYRPFWPDMEAFAMPSFYDGRVRVNLMGRERYGMVPASRYHQVVDRLKALLQECADFVTSKTIVAGFSEPRKSPFDVGSTESDLYINWAGLPTGIVHPEFGRVGPVPFRRTGGHSGPFGFLYCAHAGMCTGNFGEASSFAVVPTLFAILGEHTHALPMLEPVNELRYARSRN